MTHASWLTLHGSRRMAHGPWPMTAHGSWLTPHGSCMGSWLMAHGSWLMFMSHDSCRLLRLVALRAASEAATEEATKERTEDAGQQGLDLSTSSRGRGERRRRG
eukprot:scaffold4532_cov50-Phaeocystis_antarctica.AAC.1